MRLVRKTVLLLVCVVIFVALALLIGAIPTGREDSKAKGSIRIAVLTNGFHSDIAIPYPNPLFMHKAGIRSDDFPANMDAARYLVVGWGSKVFYTSVLEISDMTPDYFIQAVSLDETVMHVQPAGPIEPRDGITFLTLDEVNYDRLITAMASYFVQSAEGSAPPLPGLTHGYGDRFYAAKGRFAPWYTCNVWTGNVLRKAGVGVGFWTPHTYGLSWGLQANSE